jgi:hypothetical protein
MKAVLLLAAALAPAHALACPVCAAGDRPNAALFILAMIAAPYLVAALVIRVIRSSSAGDEP